MTTTRADDRIEALKALADPVRLDILNRIADADELACTALVRDIGVAPSTVSYHIKSLRSAGFVDVRKSGRNYFYTLRPQALRSLSDYLGAMVD
ncbi:ArsR/SmtB family transcription factor [Blastococcus sp. SYSU DS1024]